MRAVFPIQSGSSTYNIVAEHVDGPGSAGSVMVQIQEAGEVKAQLQFVATSPVQPDHIGSPRDAAMIGIASSMLLSGALIAQAIASTEQPLVVELPPPAAA